MKKILLIDNYDSFTYNIFHSLSELGAKVEVYRNDKISLKEMEALLKNAGMKVNTYKDTCQTVLIAKKET